MNFVGKGKVVDNDSFVKILDEKVKEAKNNTKWRNEYMLLLTRDDEKFAEGIHEGENRANERVAVDMIKRNYSLDAIKDISKLSEEIIRNLAMSMGLAIS